MVTISLCMIVKNEEDTLPRCLESVKDIVDEINIIDTGSDDKTKEVAKRFTSRIFDFEWIDDFSAARNFSFSKATKDYILWLDADDVLLEEDRIKLKNLKKMMKKEVDVVMMKYNIGSNESGNPICTFYRERLLKRSVNFTWNDPVHEFINFGGNVVNTDIAITHKKIHSSAGRNLRIFEKMIKDGRELSNRHCFYYSRELYINGRFNDAIIYYNKFLDTKGELLSNYMDASIDLSKCYTSIGDKENALKALLRAFEHEPPRAEICCEIGYYYKNQNDFLRAVAWFEIATKLKKPESTWGSVVHDSWDYIPYMELCSCYYKLGKIKEAHDSVLLAVQHKPNDPMALHNKNFIESVIESVKQI